MLRLQNIAYVVAIASFHGWLVGCADHKPTSRVYGKVSIAGEAIPPDATAIITLTPLGFEAEATSAEIVNGRYVVQAARGGPTTATFEISQPYGPEKKSLRTGVRYRELRSLVPDRSVGGVAFEVAEGELNRDFDL